MSTAEIILFCCAFAYFDIGFKSYEHAFRERKLKSVIAKALAYFLSVFFWPILLVIGIIIHITGHGK